VAIRSSGSGVARRLLFFAFVFGCAVSAIASGRFTARLILDGMLSFAFVPIVEIGAFAILWRTRLRAVAQRGWSSVAATFLDGNQPWLIWLIAASAVFITVPPRAMGPWIRLAEISTIVPIWWSIRIDLRFFRSVLSRATRAAVADVVMFRAVAWTIGLGYFLGIAIWAELGL
jgi:hypothetical protein